MSKTELTVTFVFDKWQREEKFLRPASLPTPTYRGAARMVAGRLNDDPYADDGVRPSDISVERIEEAYYFRTS